MKNLSGVLKINFLKTPRFEHYRKLLFLSLFLIKLLWDFAKTHLQLDHCDNNNTIRKNFLSTIFRRKEKKKIIFHFSNILPNPSKRIPPPSSNIRNSTPGKLAGPCIPLHPLLCFHKSQRGRALQEWAGAGAPTVTLGAPVAATLASFLLLLFVIPPFLRFFPSPFLPTSFPSLPRSLLRFAQLLKCLFT